MALKPIDDIDDPRIEPYRQLKDRELARRGGLFIAEGEHLVRRLLASDFPVHSLLLAQRRAQEIAPLASAATPVYLAPDELMKAILGFKFHSGVIACGVRKAETTLSELFALSGGGGRDAPITMVICPDIINTQNLGAIIRVAAAFGATGLLLGPQCCDPFWRQSVRVSMGAVFRLPLVRSTDFAADLQLLRERWRMQLIATVLDPGAQPLHTGARPAPPAPDRVGLLLGGEAQGLARQWVDMCDSRLSIPMQLGTDSLNVATAAAVFLYHFTLPAASQR